MDGIFKEGSDTSDFFDGISNVLKNDKVTKEMTDSLFAAFDLNSSDSISKKELAGGLSLACMGNLEDRITFAFEQYVFPSDSQLFFQYKTHSVTYNIYCGDDNMINIQDLSQYFTSVFSVLKRLHPDAPEFQVEGSVKKLASSTASTCMKTLISMRTTNSVSTVSSVLLSSSSSCQGGESGGSSRRVCPIFVRNSCLIFLPRTVWILRDSCHGSVNSRRKQSVTMRPM